MIFTLEFYYVDEAGSQVQLARQYQTAKSRAIVEARARATLKNVLSFGRRPNLCVIKDSKGKTLNAVVSNRKDGRRPAAAAFAPSVAT